jgi:Alkyl sulfatase C-terminal
LSERDAGFHQQQSGRDRIAANPAGRNLPIPAAPNLRSIFPIHGRFTNGCSLSITRYGRCRVESSGPPSGSGNLAAAVRFEPTDLDQVILGTTRLLDHLESGRARVDGGPQPLHELIDLVDDFEFWFNIVTP